jgi:hypothetical protein
LIAMIVKKFEVEGSGEFPIDMLRYDQCWPTDTADALKIRPAYGGDGSGLERRTISLSTTGKYVPTRGRWDSFTWRVIG